MWTVMLLLWMLGAALVAACGGGAEPTPTSTPAVRETMAATITSTPSPTATPTIGPTPIQPPSPSPTIAPSPSPTATAVVSDTTPTIAPSPATASPTATQIPQLTPTNTPTPPPTVTPTPFNKELRVITDDLTRWRILRGNAPKLNPSAFQVTDIPCIDDMRPLLTCSDELVFWTDFRTDDIARDDVISFIAPMECGLPFSPFVSRIVSRRTRETRFSFGFEETTRQRHTTAPSQERTSQGYLWR